MAIPLSHVFFDPRSANDTSGRYWRDIESHYHLGMIAESSEQVVKFQSASLALQVETARENLRAMGRMTEGLDHLNATATATLEAIEEQTEAIQEQTNVLRECLEVVADLLLAQHKTLLEIAGTLRRPYETQMLELREQADKWLTSGMRNTGRARDDDFDDAMRLLKEAIKNPIGNQDYVTWFQIGWLLWKRFARLPDAEKAFYRASRLSAPQTNLYHSLSARHLAYMQYLQGRHEEAFATVQKAVAIALDPQALYDAARYAAKTGRKAESLALLDRCIELVPTAVVTMFTEEDFKS